ncbi:zinc-finger domain-containing protein [Rhodovulum sp. DZ06]|uniref:zinc-finger domain-containing protein n=1 Tax=Rhodovulum sp. DZ06 TaxID=3425126 RepID=UPI003D34C72C
MTRPAPESETVTKTRVACDGGEGALGHPRVWLSIPEAEGFVECGYCDKRFILKGGPADASTDA